MTITEFQRLIERTYFARDSRRGLAGTFMWFAEEVGELSTALRCGTKEEQQAEFADVLAWLVTLASIAGVKMDEAVKKYVNGCPACKSIPCACREKE